MRKAEDYSWITTEMFQKKLEEIFMGLTYGDILSTPGVQDIFQEELNNEVIEALEAEKDPEEDDEEEAVSL